MRFFATCARGTEGALRAELAALRLPAVRGGRGGVAFEGRLEHGARACLHARTAMRVLLELASFPVDGPEALYEGARAVAWEEWLTARTTLAVEAAGEAPGLGHTGFVALKVKDAVVDRLRERLGERPDVDPKDPDVRVVVHLDARATTLSLDLSGEPLHRRGWRATTTVAPLKETLAAAVLALGRVDPGAPFVDPLCGSGTLAIEQALRARRLAPGLGRAFGFQRWPVYRGELQSAYDRLRAEARALALPRAPAPILAVDLHPRAVEAARRNAAAAGVGGDVVVEQGDARDLQPRFEPGTLCMNPPYGERLMGAGEGARGRGGERPGRGGPREGSRREAGGRRGRGEAGRDGADGDGGGPPDRAALRTADRKLEGFYRGLAEMLLRHERWSAVILSGNPLLARAIPRRAEIDHRLWNGPLEVHLLRYRL